MADKTLLLLAGDFAYINEFDDIVLFSIADLTNPVNLDEHRMPDSVFKIFARGGLLPGTTTANVIGFMAGGDAALIRSIERFEPQDATAGFRGWVWTITKNKIRDHFKQIEQSSSVTVSVL